jgi:hypothetical protein
MANKKGAVSWSWSSGMASESDERASLLDKPTKKISSVGTPPTTTGVQRVFGAARWAVGITALTLLAAVSFAQTDAYLRAVGFLLSEPARSAGEYTSADLINLRAVW